MNQNKPSQKYIARVRGSDSKVQSIEEHLLQAAAYSKLAANKVGVPDAGELLGLMHDFGKYSQAFQSYIKVQCGLSELETGKAQAKGSVDHSTAGAQWIWDVLPKADGGVICAHILAMCIASHHSGLIDSIDNDFNNTFLNRIAKSDEETHLEECRIAADQEILHKAIELASERLVSGMFEHILCFLSQYPSDYIRWFNIGFFTRFLFSGLIDADRISSADFETPSNKESRGCNSFSWSTAIDRLEKHLAKFTSRLDTECLSGEMGKKLINEARQKISDACLNRATDNQGIFTLTVPTGGGKTLASLRFALSHAKKHNLDRVVYVVPFTSIIEQNAQQIRSIIEHEDDERPWVLEHHSNLEPEVRTEHSKLASENWDSPIILTTMVQFLETLFGGGTRGVRRLHQLANSVIIFDEIQTLPIRCVHLFCNALNFLTNHAKTTAVLCTATQPLLNSVISEEKGRLSSTSELTPEAMELFSKMPRVEICNKTKHEGWTEEEIVDFVLSEYNNKNGCLVIVNTKAWAKALYLLCEEHCTEGLFHLSTGLCPAHRKKLFNIIKDRLKNGQKVLCISTQLIEAGVDIDFPCVIRFLAGLDSIHQAAGRCNRHGLREKETVYVINPQKENIDFLTDIKIGKSKAERVLHEKEDLLSSDAITTYFKYYFFERSDEMDYPLNAKKFCRDDTLLNLLSTNENNSCNTEDWQLRQSFSTAGKCFKAIDAPTQSIIVPYNETAIDLIGEICSLSKEFNPQKYRKCLREAQQFSINVFPNDMDKLREKNAVKETNEDEGIFILSADHYSQNFGLSIEGGCGVDSFIL